MHFSKAIRLLHAVRTGSTGLRAEPHGSQLRPAFTCAALFPHQVDVQVALCSVISDLASSKPAFIDQLCDLGAVRTTLDAMDRFEGVQAVQTAACLTLKWLILKGSELARSQIVDGGGIQKLLRAKIRGLSVRDGRDIATDALKAIGR